MQRRDTRRFSLLLLDDGDHYVKDWVATCHVMSGQGGANLKGRLRLCIRSIFFEPRDVEVPIFMFPLRKNTDVSCSESTSRLLVTSDSYVKMKPSGEDTPYEFVRAEQEEEAFHWEFSLDYSRIEELMSELRPLLRMVGLPYEEREPAMQRLADAMEAAAQFDVSRLVDLSEHVALNCLAAQITPLVREPGRLVVTQLRLYFQPLHSIGNESPVRSFLLGSLVAVAHRQHCFRHTGLEVFFSRGPEGGSASLGGGCASKGSLGDPCSAFFTFGTQALRDQVAAKLLQLTGGPASRVASANALLEAHAGALHQVTEAWKSGQLSNYEYLLSLNLAAGRSFNDLAQWPVMPWVLQDYSSPSLDLSDPAVFRDLAKPIGALNGTRLQDFLMRYVHMLRDEAVTGQKAFLYGTHYSSPGYVLYWLVRIAPAHMLRLQNGRFDAPDRLFNGMRESWDSVLNNASDVKELIPEFFAPPSNFLVLPEELHLGVRQNGTPVANVELPAWASDADDFISQHADALESEHVSRHLHHWIDLIFGFKQKGKEAEEAHNLFHPLTYAGAVDLDTVDSLVQRRGYEAQINEFGQTPRQLFSKPHPQRAPLAHRSRHVGLNRRACAHVAQGLAPFSAPGALDEAEGGVGGEAERVGEGSGGDIWGADEAPSPSPSSLGGSPTNCLLWALMRVLQPLPPAATGTPSQSSSTSHSQSQAQGMGTGKGITAAQGAQGMPGPGASAPHDTSARSGHPAAARDAASTAAGLDGDVYSGSTSGGAKARGGGVGAAGRSGAGGWDAGGPVPAARPLAEDARGVHLWLQSLKALSVQDMKQRGTEWGRGAPTEPGEGGAGGRGASAGMKGTGAGAEAGSDVAKRQALHHHHGAVTAVALLTSQAADSLASLMASIVPSLTGEVESEEGRGKADAEGSTLFSCGRDGLLKVYSVARRVRLRSAQICHRPLTCMALAPQTWAPPPSYPIVLVGADDDCIWAYSPDYCRLLGRVPAHDDALSALRVGPTGSPLEGSFFSASADRTVKQWSLEATGWAVPGRYAAGASFVDPGTPGAPQMERGGGLHSPVAELFEHDAPVGSLALGAPGTPAHSLVLSGAENGVAVAWDVRSPGGAVAWSSRVAAGAISGIQCSSDGRYCVLSSHDGSLRCLEMRMGAARELMQQRFGAGKLLCCELGGYTAVAGSEHGSLCFWSWDDSPSSAPGAAQGSSRAMGQGRGAMAASRLARSAQNAGAFTIHTQDSPITCLGLDRHAKTLAAGCTSSIVHVFH